MSTPIPYVDYSATAVRPTWEELPAPVRDLVAEVGGARVVSAAAPAGSGFSRGYAGLVDLEDGRTVFVKAAGADLPYAFPSYRREAEVLRLLPARVPAPGLVGSGEVTADGTAWVAVAFEPVVRGRMPGQPWTETDLAAVHDACRASAEALTPGPAELELPDLADVVLTATPASAGMLGYFDGLGDGAVELPGGQPDWTRDRAPELSVLLTGMAGALRGDTAGHGDLRGDNLLIDPAGRAWIFDWNWLCRGPAWTDFVGLLPLARADGLDAEAWLRRSPLTRDVPDEAIDVWLAVIAAYMLCAGSQAEPEPLGSHRRRYARTYLDWLGARRGWAC